MSLNLAAYTACLQDRTLPEALDVIKDAGLSGAEVNVGGFIPSPHCPVDVLLVSQSARDDYLGLFAERGLNLAGMNTSGNALSPLPDQGPRHAYDLRRAIELAPLLGVDEIVCMSGVPGSDPGASHPSWVVNPWDGVYLEVLEYQKSVADPFWKEMDQRAADAGVKLAWELHPHNLVFTPVGFLEFVERTGTTNIAVNMDPSHLMWQGMDITASIELLGSHIAHVHAKDTRIEPGVATRGVLDASFGPVPEDPAKRTPTGSAHYCSSWPTDAAWHFVALGNGHDVAYWTEFLRAVQKVNPDMNVSIEHEDGAYGRVEGLQFSASTLLAAAAGLSQLQHV